MSCAHPFRDELQKHLNDAGIGTGIHYPIPVHLQKAYAAIGWKKGDFPESEEASEQILSLPMFAGLGADQQKQVAKSIFSICLFLRGSLKPGLVTRKLLRNLSINLLDRVRLVARRHCQD